MSAFDPAKFQESPNGPLNQKTIDRLVAFKNRSGMSYAALGKHLDLSGTFLHNMINKQANVGTQHIKRIAGVIAALENPDRTPELLSAAPATLQHSFHLRPGLQIKLDLPADLTDREAERLARFVQSLPVA